MGRASTLAFALRIVGTGLGFVTAVVVARSLGPEGYGAYSSAMAVGTLAAVPAALGFGPLSLRETARAGEADDWGHVVGLLRRSRQLVAGVSLLLVAVGCVLSLSVVEGPLRTPLALGLLTVPFIALAAVRQGFLQGLHRVTLALAPELVVRPAIALGLAIALAVTVRTATPTAMLVTYLIACIISFVLGSVLLHRSLPTEAQTAKPTYQTKRWLRSSVPLMLLSSVTVLDSQVGIIALTIAGSPTDVGHFAVASRLAEFLGFVTLAVNAGAGPTLAQLSAKGDLPELKRVAVHCAGLMVGATFVLGTGLVVCSGPLLQLFGGDFSDSEQALRLLVVGQVLNSAMGPVALLLIMTGNERAATTGVLVGTCLNFVLTLALADSFGVAGAAVGRAMSLIVWGAILTIVAVRRLGFSAGVWDFRPTRKMARDPS